VFATIVPVDVPLESMVPDPSVLAKVAAVNVSFPIGTFGNEMLQTRDVDPVQLPDPAVKRNV
jgi:hypothetical protein